MCVVVVVAVVELSTGGSYSFTNAAKSAQWNVMRSATPSCSAYNWPACKDDSLQSTTVTWTFGNSTAMAVARSPRPPPTSTTCRKRRCLLVTVASLCIPILFASPKAANRRTIHWIWGHFFCCKYSTRALLSSTELTTVDTLLSAGPMPSGRFIGNWRWWCSWHIGMLFPRSWLLLLSSSAPIVSMSCCDL